MGPCKLGLKVNGPKIQNIQKYTCTINGNARKDFQFVYFKENFKNHFVVIHVHNIQINIQKQDRVSVTEGHLPSIARTPSVF